MENNFTVNASNMSTLTTDAFMDCIFQEDEDTQHKIEVEGNFCSYTFHPQRLEEKRNLVSSILALIQKSFKTGDLSFCLWYTDDGKQWTDNFMVIEQLMTMSLGLNLMEYCTPEDFSIPSSKNSPFVRIK